MKVKKSNISSLHIVPFLFSTYITDLKFKISLVYKFKINQLLITKECSNDSSHTSTSQWSVIPEAWLTLVTAQAIYAGLTLALAGYSITLAAY